MLSVTAPGPLAAVSTVAAVVRQSMSVLLLLLTLFLLKLSEGLPEVRSEYSGGYIGSSESRASTRSERIRAF
jgi:hypothetical protein